MKINNVFTRKEKSEVDKKLARLKKTINKKDEFSAEQSIDMLKELTENNQNLVAAKIAESATKHNKFLDNLSAKMIRMDNDSFTADVVQEVLDYCFRYGNAEVQRNGVLLLNKYKHIDRLRTRYQFIFLKDKVASKLLEAKIYSTNNASDEDED